MMLPASDLAEIVTNLVGLQLAPDTTAAVLGAVIPPLIRSSSPAEVRPPARAQGHPPPRRKKPKRRRVKANAEPTGGGPRERARVAFQANPGATVSAIAKLAGVSHGTAVNARDDLAAEARKEARKQRETMPPTPIGGPKAAKPTERRQRAQRFLLDALARGPQPVSDIEEQAAKAHIEVQVLDQARADLGIVTSRSNTGGVQAVQWRLPG